MTYEEINFCFQCSIMQQLFVCLFIFIGGTMSKNKQNPDQWPNKCMPGKNPEGGGGEGMKAVQLNCHNILQQSFPNATSSSKENYF